jgi:hypothetical protein
MVLPFRYDFLRPYLVGFYLAQHQFQSDRDVNGWVWGVGMDDGLEDELDAFEARAARTVYSDDDYAAPGDTEWGDGNIDGT